MGSATISLTDDAFDTTVKQGLVLVDFYADWCGPCRIVSPLVEQIAGELQGKLVVAKMDVDANPRTAMRYGVMSIPTLILFKDGKPVDMVVGAAPKAALRQWIDEHLANGGPPQPGGYA
ncbi:MAG TPA: thioredoxin [Candidatus Thermoplasmatota archaeon]|jgi:thioredoxin 1|nr:thioredoxin [Candidatus Thermoplasmatota archaeon]